MSSPIGPKTRFVIERDGSAQGMELPPLYLKVFDDNKQLVNKFLVTVNGNTLTEDKAGPVRELVSNLLNDGNFKSYFNTQRQTKALSVVEADDPSKKKVFKAAIYEPEKLVDADPVYTPLRVSKPEQLTQIFKSIVKPAKGKDEGKGKEEIQLEVDEDPLQPPSIPPFVSPKKAPHNPDGDWLPLSTDITKESLPASIKKRALASRQSEPLLSKIDPVFALQVNNEETLELGLKMNNAYLFTHMGLSEEQKKQVQQHNLAVDEQVFKLAAGYLEDILKANDAFYYKEFGNLYELIKKAQKELATVGIKEKHPALNDLFNALQRAKGAPDLLKELGNFTGNLLLIYRTALLPVTSRTEDTAKKLIAARGYVLHEMLITPYKVASSNQGDMGAETVAKLFKKQS